MDQRDIDRLHKEVEHRRAKVREALRTEIEIGIRKLHDEGDWHNLRMIRDFLVNEMDMIADGWRANRENMPAEFGRMDGGL